MADIRKSIRDKVGRKLRSITKWSPESQPNLYELANFLRKSGYRLVEVIDHGESPELIIESIRSGYLHPEISHDIEERRFYVRVEDHGFLAASDVQEIIKGYNTALGVIQHLDSLDLSKLEIYPEE